MARIITLPYGLFQACSYLICLPSACCLIDPTVPPARLPAGIGNIRLIMATHGHIDHICQADVLRRLTRAPLWIHPEDSDCLTSARQNLSAIMQNPAVFEPAEMRYADGQRIKLDDNYSIEVIHTPGHTAGGVCLLLWNQSEPLALFTGDTLFAGSIGRLDLGGDPAAMQQSLIRLCRLGARPEMADLPVYPGHGPATTLRQERLDNPYLQDLPD